MIGNQEILIVQEDAIWNNDGTPIDDALLDPLDEDDHDIEIN